MNLTIQHFLLGLFAVANNFPAIAPFLALCVGLETAQIKRLAFIATGSVFITMIIAMLAGQSILAFFGISIDAFRATGGIILCISGLKMFSSDNTESNIEKKIISFDQKIPVAIVPIAIPLTAGAGTIATITIFAGELKRAHQEIWGLFCAILIMSVGLYFSFRYSTHLVRLLGKTGMNVLVKITNLLIVAIGIQFIFNALISIFPGLSR